MNTRIRQLRQTLKLSQKAFAEEIGLKQNAISYMEKSGATVTEHNVKAICARFNVNEKWLKTGTGDMFITENKKYNDFFAIFDSLSPSMQDYLIKTAADLLDAQNKMLQQ